MLVRTGNDNHTDHRGRSERDVLTILPALSEMEDTQHTVVLGAEERAEFAALLAGLPPHDVQVRHGDDYYEYLKALGRQMPPRLLGNLDRFRMRPLAFPKGYILLRNLPHDAVRSTPRSHRDPVCDPTTVCEWVNMTISNALGDTFSLANEFQGEYPNRIIPEEGLEEQASSSSSGKTLGWHCDLIAMGEAQASWLALTCVTAAPRGTGATTVAPLWDALPRISAPGRAMLRRDVFEIDPPSSCQGQIPALPTAVLCGDEGSPYLTYLQGKTRPRDPQNEAALLALKELDAALDAACIEIHLNPGDTLIFRNGDTGGWNLAHGRALFQARFTNADFQSNRFLLRSYVHQRLTPLLRLRYPNTRVLVPTTLYRAALP